MNSMVLRFSAIVLVCWLVLLGLSTPARAQHGDYILGTVGLEGGSQAPPGFYYQNLWSWYHASGSDFAAIGPLKCGPSDKACLSLNVGGSGNLDLFVDQNFLGWTSPYKILGANYGLFVDIPFVYADANGAASLQPILALPQRTVSGGTFQTSGESTKGSIGSIYLEPIDLGWHFRHLDAVISSGVIMPSGGYNPQVKLNTGVGNAAGLFGLGTVLYPDAERTWSLSIYTHYLLYASQIGRPYTLGNVVPFEWGAGKAFSLNNDLIKRLTFGAVGYAQWQVTNGSIDLNPTSTIGISALNTLEHTHSAIYSAGPAISVLTKYGLFSLRYYEEFAAHATPSGRQLMFGVAF